MRNRKCGHGGLIALLFAALAVLACPTAAQTVSERDDLIGRVETIAVSPSDVVFDIARANNLGQLEVLAANPGLDPWMPRPDVGLVLPKAHLLPSAPRKGLVINVGDMRAFYYRGNSLIFDAPIGVAREGFHTPMGTTKIVRKRKNPTWYPPKIVHEENPDLPNAVPPGPDNPLGDTALYLGWPAVLLHGTNKPDGVGRRVSHGCIRFYPESIHWLYENLPVGTLVTVVREPVKLGWHDGEIFLEAHPEPGQLDALEEDYDFEPEPFDEIVARIDAFAGERAAELDRSAIMIALMRRSGVPTQITNTDLHPISIDATPDMPKAPN